MGTSSRITVLSPDEATAVELDYAALADAVCRVAARDGRTRCPAGDRVRSACPPARSSSPCSSADSCSARYLSRPRPPAVSGINAFVDRFGLLLRYLQPSAVVAGAQLTAGLLGTVADRLLIDGAKPLEHALTEPGPPHRSDAEQRRPGIHPMHLRLDRHTQGRGDLPGQPCGQLRTDRPSHRVDVRRRRGRLAAPLPRHGPDLRSLYAAVRGRRHSAVSTHTVRAHASGVAATREHLSRDRDGGPNFAFGLAADKIRDDQLDGVDLTALRLAFCGSEAVHAATAQRFVDRVARWGAPADAVVPAYGMAEAGLAITSAPRRTPVAFDSISWSAAGRHGEARDVDLADPDAIAVTDCGNATPATEVRIVDDEGQPVGDDILGQVQFRDRR